MNTWCYLPETDQFVNLAHVQQADNAPPDYIQPAVALTWHGWGRTVYVGADALALRASLSALHTSHD